MNKVTRLLEGCQTFRECFGQNEKRTPDHRLPVEK